MSGIISKLKFVPSMITCTSALCGTLATFMALSGDTGLVYASYLILFASVCDFSDGFAARLLHAQSELGKQLDSLADAISFGVAPTAIMFGLLKQALRANGALWTLEWPVILVLVCSCFIVICSVLRLAKFNIDPEQAYGFKGLPTPACALLVASIPLINAMVPEDFWIYTVAHALCNADFPFGATIALIGLQVFVFGSAKFLLPMCILFSLLMVSNLPMFSLKMKSYKYRDNRLVYNFLIFAVISLIVLQWIAVPLIIFSYVIVSFVRWLVNRNAKKTEE
ncbi:MAG: CDP-alcohol phosphatidyltransferase family protein [Bacteroidales bacterium]|nr:CDP-alcohol phosphatidyltransferase family protein [Bacteroidales bacterium]